MVSGLGEDLKGGGTGGGRLQTRKKELGFYT